MTAPPTPARFQPSTQVTRAPLASFATWSAISTARTLAWLPSTPTTRCRSGVTTVSAGTTATGQHALATTGNATEPSRVRPRRPRAGAPASRGADDHLGGPLGQSHERGLRRPPQHGGGHVIEVSPRPRPINGRTQDLVARVTAHVSVHPRVLVQARRRRAGATNDLPVTILSLHAGVSP